MIVKSMLCNPSEVRHFLDEIKSTKTDKHNLFDLEDMIKQGQTYKVIASSGEAVGAYVLAAYDALLWVLAAGGRAAFDLSKAMFQLIELQAKEFTYVGFRTERPGLVKKALKAGYEITEKKHEVYFLRKRIQP